MVLLNDRASIMVSKSWADGDTKYKYELTLDSPHLIGPVSFPISSADELRHFAESFDEMITKFLDNNS